MLIALWALAATQKRFWHVVGESSDLIRTQMLSLKPPNYCTNTYKMVVWK